MRSVGIRTLVTLLALFTLAVAAPEVEADTETGAAEIDVVEPAEAEIDVV